MRGSAHICAAPDNVLYISDNISEGQIESCTAPPNTKLGPQPLSNHHNVCCAFQTEPCFQFYPCFTQTASVKFMEALKAYKCHQCIAVS